MLGHSRKVLILFPFTSEKILSPIMGKLKRKANVDTVPIVSNAITSEEGKAVSGISLRMKNDNAV